MELGLIFYVYKDNFEEVEKKMIWDQKYIYKLNDNWLTILWFLHTNIFPHQMRRVEIQCSSSNCREEVGSNFNQETI